MPQLNFTVYCTPTPQGSMRGFVVPGKNGKGPRAIVTSANKKMVPYRNEVTSVIMRALGERLLPVPLIARDTPVSLCLNFYLRRPNSAKKRKGMTVKPDLDKLIRSTKDAMTGILYVDDSQVVEVSARKEYGTPERVEVSITADEPGGQNGKAANETQKLF